MNMLKPLGRFTVRSLSAAILAMALDGTAATGWAQVPAPASSEAAAFKKTFTKNTVFNLPIHMDERTRASLDRVCLYVKAGNAPWVRQESAPPTLPHFSYRVQTDGEYCFTLVTIDKSGRAIPADVNTEPPSLRVVVDTRPPVLSIQPWTSPEGEACVRCTVSDANIDMASVKGLVRGASGEKLLQPHPVHPGVFKVSGHDPLTSTVVVLASDLAGNMATKEARLSDLIPAPVQAAQAVTARTEPNKIAGPLISEGPTLPPIPAVPLPELKEPPALPTTAPVLPPAPPAEVPATPPALPATVTTAASSPSLRPAPESPVVRPSDTVANRVPAGGVAKQLINTTHAVVDYRVEQVGPSGISKVEVYMTPDQGQTWQRISEDHDRRSPVEFDLPGEGVYGIRLAITNGNGFGGAVPQRGDSPTCLIEVDSTGPFVQLRPIEPMVSNGALEIRWHATDKNLPAEPVNLFYRTRNEGPWQVIARGVKNEGMYRWNFPRESAQFFVKVEVVDQSGNIARAESPNPIVLDTTEPRATVINVTGLSVRTAQ
jgi:hypothetical protein